MKLRESSGGSRAGACAAAGAAASAAAAAASAAASVAASTGFKTPKRGMLIWEPILVKSVSYYAVTLYLTRDTIRVTS